MVSRAPSAVVVAQLEAAYAILVLDPWLSGSAREHLALKRLTAVRVVGMFLDGPPCREFGPPGCICAAGRSRRPDVIQAQSGQVTEILMK